MSDVNKAAAVKAALPFLQEMGLLEPCQECPATKQAVKELERLNKGVSLHAHTAYSKDGNQSYVDVKIVGGLVLYCKKCKGFEFVPTKRGWQLIGFVKLWFEDCDAVDFTEVNEIPF